MPTTPHFTAKHLYALVCTLQMLCFFSFESKTQSKIQGSVIDINGKGISNANVLLLRPKDSFLLKGAITDVGGSYSFQNISAGKYLVSASFMGFDLGTNGSYSLTAGNAKRGLSAASINFNHRKGKTNLYGDYSFSRTHLIQVFQIYRLGA